jgi:VWFA-related protein
MRTLLVAISLAALTVSQPQRPVIRSAVTYVTTDLVVKNDRGQFVADLGKDDFDVFEDGVKQKVVTFVLSHGGQILKDVAPDSVAREGVLLPPARTASDSSGRIFLIFVDDLHMNFRDTGRIRDLFKKITQELVHEGDLFGMVSSGPSSIAVDMTYDRQRLDEAIRKISGAALKPDEIISTPGGSQGPPEVRYRAHVAFSTVYDVLQKLEQVHNRRKALIYVSSGYDFDPFAKARAAEASQRFGSSRDSGQVPDTNPFSKTGNEFAAADLVAELAELTREANRANTTIYTLDPRGLAGGPDIDQKKVSASEWQDYLRETQSSLRVIAERTGGIPVVSTNDFTAALKRIDNDTSDYYILGYYSTNANPSKTRRAIEVRVKPDKRRTEKLQLSYKTSYTLKPSKS